jgi:glutaredoxin 3
MPKITVYTTDPCSFCVRAKQLLEKRNLVYEEINLAKDPAGRAELLAKTGMMSFPQIIIDGTVVGGFMELVAADGRGLLRELAARAA